MFEGCGSLTELDLSGFQTQNAVNMRDMFYNCRNLVSLDLHGFDTARVSDMSGMFEQCASLRHLDLSRFVTKNLTGMERMFYQCKSLMDLDLEQFDFSSLKMNEEGCCGIHDMLTSVQELKKVKMPANLPEEAMLPCGKNDGLWMSEDQKRCKSAAAGLDAPMVYIRI